MTATITLVDHPLHATKHEQFQLASGLWLDQWLIEQAGITPHQLQDEPPIAIVLNGEPLEDWHYQLQPDDRLLILPRPYALQVLQVVQWLAVAMSIASFFLMPEVPEAAATDMESSPSYSADAQGNRARLGSPIPVVYGDVRIWPDFAAKPYRRYINHDQYLYQLFSLGQGEIDYSEIRIGNTALESFNDVDYYVYEAGSPVYLFPTAVIESDAVRDVQIYAPNARDDNGNPRNTRSPAFAACPEGTQATRLELDFTFPAGLYQMENSGPRAASVSIYIDIRETDGDGHFSRELDHTFEGNSTDVHRFTLELALPAAGRYDVQVQRYSDAPKNNSYRQKTDIHWTGLRAFLDDPPVFDHPVMALKMRVDDQLSHQSERKINLRLKRKLPRWNPDSDSWSAAEVTRNPAWAFCDAIRSRWGGQFTDEELDLEQIAEVARQFDEENVYFDGIFDTPGKLWSVLQQLCGVDNAKPILSGGLFSIRRDVEEVAQYSFGMADIIDNSFQIEYTTPDRWGYDSVEIEYTDPTSWKPATVLCSVTDQHQRPHKVKLRGCTQLDQARRVGHHIAAAQTWRNRRVSWKSELNGRLPAYGDVVQVCHEYPQWGISGTVLDVADDGRTLTLSEPVGSQGGWLTIPAANGQLQGPWPVTAGADEYEVQLPANHNASIRTPALNASQFASSFAFADNAEPVGLPVKIRSIRASGDFEVELSGEYDSPRVYNPPLLPLPDPDNGSGSGGDGSDNNDGGGGPGQTPITLLEITGLVIAQQGSLDAPVLQVSWNPLADAHSYRVEYRYGDGNSHWQAGGQPSRAEQRLEVQPGIVHVRVAAEVEGGTGPWQSLRVIAGDELGAPDAPTGLRLREPFRDNHANLLWNSVPGCQYIVEVVVRGQVRHSEVTRHTRFSYNVEQASSDGVGRSFTVQVYSEDRRSGVRSVVPATLTIGNPAPAKLTNIKIMAGIDSLNISFNPSQDPDLKGYIVYFAPTPQPVTLNSPSRLFPATGGFISLGIPDTRIYRVRIAAYDSWGLDDLNLSDTTADMAAGIRESQLAASLRNEIAQIPLAFEGLTRVNDELTLLDGRHEQSVKRINEMVARQNSDDLIIAGIRETQQVHTNDIEANAESVSKMQAAYQQADTNMNNSLLATIEEKRRVLADADTALAQLIDTTQINLNNRIGSVEERHETLEDDLGQVASLWSVKVEAPQSRAFVGLSAVENNDSILLMGADQIAFASSKSNVEHFPFHFRADPDNGGRETLFVDNAWIGEGEIGTLKLAGHAVTVPDSLYMPTERQFRYDPEHGSKTFHLADLGTNTQGGKLHITLSATLRGRTTPHGDGDTGILKSHIIVKVDGQQVYRSGEMNASCQFSASFSIPGNNYNRTISAYISVQSGVMWVSSLSIVALGTKR